jgi:uncharacterized iron-regulated membrane protein
MSALPAESSQGAFFALIKRLHFYIGLFVGPFILVAALSGLIYALTPQIEDLVYAEVLHSPSQGPALSLEAQVRSAQEVAGAGASVAAVRPAPRAGDTTRVMFNAPGLGESEHRALFVDPVSGEIRGDLTVYGTSGILPLRTWIDDFHRSLLLGNVGRIYSELAASWLWIAALGGLVLWAVRRGRLKAGRKSLRSWHASVGLWLTLGLLFFSATGLTWSQYAGDNIGVLRAYYGWSTPSVSTALAKPAQPDMSTDLHAGHHMPMASSTTGVALDPALFDAVLASARRAHVDAAKIEIRPSSNPEKAWVVAEIDRSWPTQVDAVSINPHTLAVVDHVEFANYSVAAKLTRWGIDAHMGILFGLANQLVLVFVASGLVAMVCVGYLMWWRRRPGLVRQPTVIDAWRQSSLGARIAWPVVAIALGICLPVLGASLLALLAGDLIVSLRAPSVALRQSRS